jgi:hypothetical protein
MRFSIRDLLRYYVWVSYIIGGIFFVLMVVIFAILAPLVILEKGEHPVKTVLSIVAAECIAAVLLGGVGIAVRVAWQALATPLNEPPSWGSPPPLPNSSAPHPENPKGSTTAN